jgi:Zn-dependent protease/CBS domain-containing protein
MKWSWKIARVAGIDILVHSTFLLLLGFVAVSYWITDRSLAVMIEGVFFLVAMFTCVLLHELGHSLMAQKYGIKTKDIILLPIGGVARLERMPENPMHELWVALAGPFVNAVIAGLLFAVLLITKTLEPLSQITLTQGNILERLLAVNAYLLLFNLIPAFPMDGGRVVRALLATRIEYHRATQIAATLGQGIALIFGFIGLFSNPLLVFIALFVWIGAAQESSTIQTKSALHNISVSKAMLTDFHTISPTDPLAVPVQLTLAGSQRDFPVVTDDAVVGILTRENLLRALVENNENVFVSFVMRKDFQVINSAQMLEDVSHIFQVSKQGIIPVVENGILVGLLTMDNIGEFLLIENAIKKRGKSLSDYSL